MGNDNQTIFEIDGENISIDELINAFKKQKDEKKSDCSKAKKKEMMKRN